jgi:peptidoglycan hydrolase-like protein with peptidoglycan-binding domain
VDDKPVVLLCGAVLAYRDLHTGEAGQDVRQLNRNLHELGYDAKAHVHIEPADNDFAVKTEKALKVLQHNKGFQVSGALAIGDAVFLSDRCGSPKVTGELGGPGRPGAPVLNATSDKLHVQVALDPSQLGEVEEGRPRPHHSPGQHAGS